MNAYPHNTVCAGCAACRPDLYANATAAAHAVVVVFPGPTVVTACTCRSAVVGWHEADCAVRA